MVATADGAGRIPPAHTPRVGDEADPVSSAAVSYTHLRAHET